MLSGPPPAWRAGLTHHGLPVQETTCIEVARRWAAHATVQALIVCVDRTSDKQALALCRWAPRHPELAVLVWSPHEHPTEALDVDDWITGAIEPIELAARVRAALRRSNSCRHRSPADPGPTVDSQPWQVDVQHRALMSEGGTRIALSPREWQLWMVLLSHRGHVLSPQRLGELMCDAEQGMHAIQLLVSRLRHKLQRAGGQSPAIEAVRGWGYRLPPAINQPASVMPDKFRHGTATL